MGVRAPTDEVLAERDDVLLGVSATVTGTPTTRQKATSTTVGHEPQLAQQARAAGGRAGARPWPGGLSRR